MLYVWIINTLPRKTYQYVNTTLAHERGVYPFNPSRDQPKDRLQPAPGSLQLVIRAPWRVMTWYGQRVSRSQEAYSPHLPDSKDSGARTEMMLCENVFMSMTLAYSLGIASHQQES